MSDFSRIDSVKLDHGLAQWVEARCTGTVEDSAERTHAFGIPPLMPATIIFVHGVNSEGEWYEDAASQFAEGLKRRLGREDLQPLIPDPDIKYRLLARDLNRARIPSPIIPFYWGYSVPPGARKQIVEDSGNLPEERPQRVDEYGNWLHLDGAWGGGPFQNGTSNLLQFWLPQGFRKKVGLIDVNSINPIHGRVLRDCPDRAYYVHAARRLANLVKTIRDQHENEPINIVSHSQGTMIALCSLFYTKQMGVRGPTP